MITLQRTGPLHDAQVGLAARWGLFEGMEVAAVFADDDVRRLQQAGVVDLSFKRRAGVKGPGARAWLEAQGMATPAQPNRWQHTADGALVGRLGLTEYVVVDAADDAAMARLSQAAPAPGVYAVPRFDAELLLAGQHVHDVFKQTCTFDFESLDLSTQPLVMTSMVGVGVTVLAIAGDKKPYYRLWCDGTYGPYLWRTLTELATSFGGGAVGVEALGSLAR